MPRKAKVTEDEAQVSQAEEAPEIVGAVKPPFIIVHYSDGQMATIPVDFGHIVQVLDGNGAVVASFSLQGVSGMDYVL